MLAFDFVGSFFGWGSFGCAACIRRRLGENWSIERQNGGQ